MINVNCSICGNKSGYNKKSLKGSTWIINGQKIVMCCPCEDDLKKKLNKYDVKDLKDWLKRFEHILSSDDIEDLNWIINKLSAKYN